jgi:hypothetical protein
MVPLIMNAKLGFFLIVPALALGQGPAWGQDAPAAQLSKGRVLLLANERTMEGDIDKVGDQYRICRGQSETWIPAEPGMRLCADWPDVYEAMKTRANLADPDERLRLARWCHVNNLHEQAVREVQWAVEMRPQHAETKKWLQVLQRAADNGKATKVSTPTATVPTTTKLPASHDLNADTVIAFTARVQPILMNVCAGCHSGGRGGAFQLSRSYEGGTKASAQRNLAAVMAQVNVDKPALSPILVKALSAHDGKSDNPPLSGRQTVPFLALQSWVEQTVANNPHLHGNTPELTSQRPPAALPRQPETVAMAPFVLPPPGPVGKKPIVSKTVDRIPDSPMGPNQTTLVRNPPAVLPAAVQQAQPLPLPAGPNPNDPFDPDEFNRQHPSKKE